MKNIPFTLFLYALYFIIIQTSYFWLGLIGPFALPVLFILFLLFLVLIVQWFKIVIHLTSEKWLVKRHLSHLLILGSLILLVGFAPKGLIDFEKMEPEPLFTAVCSGNAGCTSYLKIINQKDFHYKQVCFGMFERSGEYSAHGDTIFFNDRELAYAVYLPKEGDSTNRRLMVYYQKEDSTTFTKMFWVRKDELFYAEE